MRPMRSTRETRRGEKKNVTVSRNISQNKPSREQKFFPEIRPGPREIPNQAKSTSTRLTATT